MTQHPGLRTVLHGLVQVTRPINGVLGIFGCLIGARLATGTLVVADPRVWLTAASVGLGVLAADAINDVFDVAIDRINRPQRPLPLGKVTPSQVIVLSLGLDALALVLAGLVSPLVAAACLGAIVLNLLYSWKLKGVPLVGNLAIALLFALPLALGGIAAGRWGYLTIPLVTAALFALGREILMDARDAEGDRLGGAVSLAGLIGLRPALGAAAGCFTAAFVIGLVPGLEGTFSPAYTLLIAAAFVVVIASLVRSWRGRTFQHLHATAVVAKFMLMLAIVALAVALPTF